MTLQNITKMDKFRISLHQTERMDFIQNFIDNKEISLTSKETKTRYELIIVHLGKQDKFYPERFCFLFEAKLKAITPFAMEGYKTEPNKFKGFINIQTGNGWIQEMKEFSWK